MNCSSRSSAAILRPFFVALLSAFFCLPALAQCDDVNANDICDPDETGCTIELACNYDPSAVFPDPNSCDFVSCLSFGCTDENACNYDDEATYDDGTCAYPAFPYGCDGTCLNDTDGDGTCDEFETLGCTDEDACNYSSGATQDDSSCTYDCGGCTNPGACNFDAEALLEDGTCEFESCLTLGCTDSSACNYDAEAAYNDGTCDFVSCLGCTDSDACNYDPSSTQDDGSCVLAEFGYDCEGNCLADADGDDVCDPFEVDGCTDASACNYDSTATDDDGSCDFCSCAEAGGVTFTASVAGYGIDVETVIEHTEGELAGLTTYRVYLTTVSSTDGVSAIVGDNEFALSFATTTSFYQESIFGGVTPSNISAPALALLPNLAYDSWVTIGLDGPASAADGEVNPSLLAGNWDDTFEAGNSFVVDDNQGSGWYLLPPTASNSLAGDDLRVLVAQLTTDGDVSGSFRAQVFPEGDQENDHRVDVTFSTGGETNVCGCTDETASNFDANATLNDGSCVYDVLGCTISLACNYNEEATVDDGTCDFVSCLSFGCTDSEACNYDDNATFEDGSCTYPAFPYDCNDECVNDNDEDGVCDEFEVFGCTDSSACNYSEGATDDDGSCAYDCLGCTNPAACNFDDDALLDDGTCEFTSCIVVGCTDPMACNYDENAQYDDGTCTFIPEGTCDCDGNTLDALGVCGGECDADDNENGVCDDSEILGCTSEFACNYDSTATVDDGSCDFISCLTFGCTDDMACNYDADAQFDDGSCTYAQFPYDCDGACVNDMDGDGICDELELPGCTDSEACNFNADATDDAGNCVYPEEYFDCNGACVNDTDGDGICDELEILGCTDINACNFNGTASDDDGSCQYLDALGVCGGECDSDENANGVCDDAEILGCTISFACNYDETATQDDGSCDFTSCLPFGCTDENACNYDPEALYEDGTCEYANFPYDCDGNCVNDSDADGICDELEIPGCVDASACNFNEDATEDADNCVYPEAYYDCNGNCLNDADGNGLCDELEIEGCTDYDACNFDPSATQDNGSCLYLDECGECGGPGAIYECGCADIPEGDCDCDGNQLDALGVCGGDCAEDADADGICDDVDDCVGALDACGVCNGPGEIYECGCSDIPEGDCDCDGNQLDALGVCGGDCAEDADADGICDDVDDCVGELDECGICNGPGAIYECGCADIPEGDCDCDGNQLDALGVCGGDCEADADADGICDDVDDCVGAYDECGICNGPGAIYECGCADIPEGDCDCDGNQLDALGVCGGDCEADADADGICDDVDDCVGAYDECGICNGPGAIYECGCADIPEGDCDCDGNQLDALGVCGGDCAEDADADGICDDVDDCVGELDECGICNGPGAIYECGCADIPEGDCDCDGNQLDALGVCGGDCAEDADADGICDDVDDCVGELDECGICNGPGAIYECGCADIPEGDCDCDGNQLDALGVCGGDCAEDADADGICDDVDDCVGAYDECGICNGPGAIYECGCADIPEGDCDCDGNQLDALGVCGGDCAEDADADGICDDVDDCVGELDECGICNGPGAIYECGCADIPEGDCDCDGNQLDALGVCGGDCEADADADGICDDVDDCVGELDECGICNGPGAIYECGCADIPEGDCDCDGNQLDALGVCGGDCAEDADADGICDDVDDCVGAYDECGICNGPGAIYECGCADIPEGDCDCDGNQLDALGVCGGDCAEDADADGICDDVDDCVGAYDECGICNGPGAIYECGCADIPEGDCDCDGNQLDALGVCGGDCAEDADADGICDDVDDCVGAYDECGICNGPGAIYECGCADIPEGDCDCDGNQLDALGVCGGDCAEDADADGICDDVDDCVGAYDECGICNGPGAIYECGCADIPEGDCDCDGNQLDALGVCGGDCEADADADGICDDVDDCVGAYDECGICNGPGAIYECGCADIPEGDCDCDGNQLDALGVCGGDCAADADADGICDDVDDCVGAYDECGICNGPGAIYECGCADIPEGDCDCDGNQLDALGVCGGDCAEDADADGICDDVDDCVGAYDECGICNGPGAIYECGCADIPEGDCDCDGNQLDALGVCGGDCAEDADADGICDDVDDCVGAYDECGICNGPGAIYECGCADIPEGDCDCDGNQLDALGVCGGDCAEDADADGICDDVDDCVGELDECGICNGPGAIYECGCADIPEGDCDCDGNQLDALGVCGGDCAEDADADGICDDVDDCVGAYDECGICNGPGAIYECGCADIPEGDCDCDGNQLDALGVCGGDCEADADADGICDDVDDCVGELDECGICNGPGAIYECGCADIPEGDCDCDGNQLDALGVCGGDCEADADADGICDDVDDCVGAYDECGICNGPGAIYECGCADIPEGDCDCDGNQLDALGVCGGDCAEDADADGICDDVDDCIGAYDECGICNGPGAIYECGCADIPEGDCDCDGNQLDALGVCGGDCAEDADADGICDDVDDCVGAYDECGICNGPGAIYECGCADIPEGDCDCDGNQLDALGVCGGDCAEDADADGICDDVDDCVGAYDECGICNGPGAIYECGCADIPEGDCDCDGNQLDALGVCGGDCAEDADADGICDDVDDCVGAYDECGICNGPGAIYECGCADIPEGDCDCDGNQLDALGVCGGDCTEDADADGICDDVDDCVGELDECGICNGPGAIYECGCSDIPAGDCDCDGNQLDALGVCGGDCAEDADADGICDDVDDCVGELDECGICNGPGAIYECGCSDIPAGDCDCDGNQLDALGVCGGDCAEDADADGICDDVDDCVGELDECGICNGPGAIYECGCADIPEGDCDCDGNQLDALGVCGGDCDADVNGNGICDDEEECLGTVDECGVCDGPGAIYECGCSDIPEGDCDCDGNQLDALGVCGGDCAEDADADGICDDVDDCVGAYDECGICNGPGAIYECGCADIPEGDCDCDGNQLDALGVCGGDCEEDANGNGLCDADEMTGCTDDSACNYNEDATFDDGSCAELDACGICGGPGAIYECGCADIPEGDCDCDGNQDDAIGVCGGDCVEDVNDNNICDTDEQGCTDSTNPNYDPNAAFDDGSCFVGGCTFPNACNYNPEADYQIQGSCDFTSCTGCTNPEACNYDAEATIDNGLCDLPDFAYDCDGNCLNDADEDGVCDELEVLGCTDGNSPNFDPYATDDDGSCLVGGCTVTAACNFDPSADYLLAGACEFSSCVGCMDVNACNFDPEALVPNLALCTYPAGQFLDCEGNCTDDADGDGVCDQFEIPGCTDPEAQNYNPQATDDNGTCQAAQVGGCILPFACNYNPEANFYIPGSCEFAPCGGVAPSDNCTHPDACNFGQEGPCEFLSCVTFGCNVSVACNFDPEAQYNDGSCEYSTCSGCMNPAACDYNPEAVLAGACYDYTSCTGCTSEGADNYDPTATLNSGVCVFGGCTIPGACNFDVTANSNDGSCDFASCVGCTDDAACNYDSGASLAGYCDYPAANFDCDGNCLLADCSAFVVEGCTDACACNFDPFANTANGSCEFASCAGCVYTIAENYDPSATRDDGSCIFEGCTDGEFATYAPQANAMNEVWCSNAPASADFNNDGTVQVEDLTQFLQAYSLAAPAWGGVSWIGSACEVDALTEEELLAAVVNNQSAGPWNPACGVPGCSYPGALNFDLSAGLDNGVCLFAGCTDVEALNYDRLANVDDNTCRYDVCPDFNGDGEVQISDLMDFLLLWGN